MKNVQIATLFLLTAPICIGFYLILVQDQPWIAYADAWAALLCCMGASFALGSVKFKKPATNPEPDTEEQKWRKLLTFRYVRKL